MRILVVTNMYPSAAQPACGTFIEQQVVGLRQRGVEVEVLYLNRLREGKRVYSKMLPILEQAIARYHPDLVAVMYGGIMAYQVTRMVTDRPVVVSFCGSDLLGENFSGVWRKWITRFAVSFSRRAAAIADGIIVKSANLRQALSRRISDSKVRIIPNGVDMQMFRPMDQQECQSALGWSGGGHVLFAANTRDPVKRPELAYAAVQNLQAAGVPVVLEEMRAVEHSIVPVWLNASDALLLTSRQEGSPNIVKEALACNRPVVSMDVGDVAERIGGIQGCHLAAPFVEDVVEKLRLIFKGPRQVRSRESMEKLSLEAVSHQLADFYGEVLDRRHKTDRVYA
jgi:teichuronic acid biosynthesis glycosyltransferase TuaC